MSGHFKWFQEWTRKSVRYQFLSTTRHDIKVEVENYAIPDKTQYVISGRHGQRQKPSWARFNMCNTFYNITRLISFLMGLVLSSPLLLAIAGTSFQGIWTDKRKHLSYTYTQTYVRLQIVWSDGPWCSSDHNEHVSGVIWLVNRILCGGKTVHDIR